MSKEERLIAIEKIRKGMFEHTKINESEYRTQILLNS